MDNVVRIVIGAVFFIVVLFVVAKLKKAAAKQAAAREAAAQRQAEEDRKRKAQEEARQRIAEDKRQQELRDAEARRIVEEREAAIERELIKYPDARKWRIDKVPEEAHSKLLTITDFTKISKTRYVAFDLETTGLRYTDDAIVEIAAVRVVDGKIVAEYEQLVDPERPMPSEASAVNHITDEMLKGKPRIYEVLPAFLSFIGDDVLAAHNARFDARFIAMACSWNKFDVPASYFDTMELARYWPEAENKKLGTLAAAAGIENDDAHRALGDARTVAGLISATDEKRKSGKSKAAAKEEPPIEAEDNVLGNKLFCVTGDFEEMGRLEVERLIWQHGGIVKDYMSGMVQYLVCGVHAHDPHYQTVKMKKAKELIEKGKPISVISYNELQRMISGEKEA